VTVIRDLAKKMHTIEDKKNIVQNPLFSLQIVGYMLSFVLGVNYYYSLCFRFAEFCFL